MRVYLIDIDHIDEFNLHQKLNCGLQCAKIELAFLRLLPHERKFPMATVPLKF